MARKLRSTEASPLVVALAPILDLPKGAWQVVLNDAMTMASFMDAECRVRHIRISDAVRERIRDALVPLPA
ncbi:hypothetical protein [Asticcacaulis solisilvae]|uniref:hypothetical protein n=1 Tax=Asticcacaulis solisilvae TaxID=1217274 RepID=UPI003FD8A43A